MPWVRNGTVSVTNGSASVTGASTTFQGSGVLPGHTFIGPDARLYEVLTVTSNTAMTIAPNYLGSTAAGQAYQIDTGPDALGQTVYQRVLELLNWIGGSIPAASAFLGTPSTQATTGSVFAARGVRAVFESASEFLLRVSRASSSHAAMLVFDDANSGRWRVGMKAASADLYIQRSADGTTFTDAVEVNATTGAATFPGGLTLANASVATAAIADGAVTTAKVADGAITSAKIADGTIATADISNAAVTSSKLASNLTVSLAAGTAAAPSLTRAGDTDTGVFFNADNEFSISAAGQVRARFTPSEFRTFVPAAFGNGTGQFQGIFIQTGDWDAGVGRVNFIDFQNSENTIVGNFHCVQQTDGGSAFLWANTPPGSRTSDRRLERMRLTSAGELLVGRANPLDFATADTEGCILGPTAIGVARNGFTPMFVKRFGSTGSMVEFYYGTVIRGTISTNGTSVSYNTTSDYRLKENVVTLTGALDRLAALKPSRFNFIADPAVTVDGFLAHEAQAVVPEAVTGVKDGPEMQGIDNGKLVPLLVAAVQELAARVAELEAR